MSGFMIAVILTGIISLVNQWRGVDVERLTLARTVRLRVLLASFAVLGAGYWLIFATLI